jgi:hypothetical protein
MTSPVFVNQSLHLCMCRPWIKFHQHFACSFYAQRSQNHKKTLMMWLFFALLGSSWVKAVHKHIGEIDPFSKFIFVEKNRKKSRFILNSRSRSLLSEAWGSFKMFPFLWSTTKKDRQFFYYRASLFQVSFVHF